MSKYNNPIEKLICGELASFRCKCGATIITTRYNEVKRAAIHMRCKHCNCYLERINGSLIPNAISVGG